MADARPIVRVEDGDNVIILPLFRFPEHWMVQDWLMNTKYGEDFELMLTEVDRGQTSLTVPALKIKSNKNGFKWILRGEEGAKELEQMILDYAKNMKYNT
jgi:hypothetical protein